MQTQLLHRTLELAKSLRGYCAPNPSVGAVIVCDDQIIAEGSHRGPGHDHAEVDALKQLTRIPLSATLYVSLEPCCHQGRTPPCTDAIIASGIKHVVFAFQDPNPIVNGSGQLILQSSGIHCEHIHLPEITEFYRSYAHWVKTKQPWVTAKLAMSLDSKIATDSGAPITLTGSELKTQTFLHRKHSDAILTTAATVIADDPEMNVRLRQVTEFKTIFILDRTLRTPLSAKIFKNLSRQPGKGQPLSRHPDEGQNPVNITVYHSPNADDKVKAQFIERGIKCVEIVENKYGLDLTQVINDIGRQGVHDLWLEAGAKCYNAMINIGLVQRALLYVAPKIIGDGMRAFDGVENWFEKAPRPSLHRHGNDVLYDFLLAGGVE